MLFDVFGSVVDWRTGVIAELEAVGSSQGIDADWPAVADDWRARYQPAMEAVRSGRRAWAPLDVLHRESLDALWVDRGLAPQPEEFMSALNLAWHRLDPWPDVVGGLTRLRTRVRVGTLSNGNTALLVDMATRAGLPWDAILGAETAQVYKPMPEAYLRSVAALDLAPEQVMLVAAHNSDLDAAAAVGVRTGFVPRPREHGPAQRSDLVAEGPWDLVAADFSALADAFGCP